MELVVSDIREAVNRKRASLVLTERREHLTLLAECLVGVTANIIYDYADTRIPVATRMFERRKKGYAAMGYEIENSEQRKSHTYH